MQRYDVLFRSLLVFSFSLESLTVEQMIRCIEVIRHEFTEDKKELSLLSRDLMPLGDQCILGFLRHLESLLVRFTLTSLVESGLTVGILCDAMEPLDA